MFGWSIEAASSDSRRKRSRNDSSSARLGSEQLEGDLPLEPQILGQVHDAHATEAQQRLDPVAGEFGADPRVVAHLHVRILAFGGLRER